MVSTCQVTIGKHKSAPPLRIGLERAGLTGVNRLALPGLSPSLKLRVQHFVIDVCQVSQRGLVGGVDLVLPSESLARGGRSADNRSGISRARSAAEIGLSSVAEPRAKAGHPVRPGASMSASVTITAGMFGSTAQALVGRVARSVEKRKA